MDMKALNSSPRPRGRCLDVFLVVSVVWLHLMVTSIAVMGTIVYTQSPSNDENKPVDGPSPGDGETLSPAFKMQNYAYLRADSSTLENCTMPWFPIPYGEGNSLGSHFGYDGVHRALEVKQYGNYFMYLNLNLTCTSVCESRGLTVQLHTSKNQLTCQVELPATEEATPVTKRCWEVKRVHQENRRFLARMTLSEKGSGNWKLELNGSGFGMFLVD